VGLGDRIFGRPACRRESLNQRRTYLGIDEEDDGKVMTSVTGMMMTDADTMKSLSQESFPNTIRSLALSSPGTPEMFPGSAWKMSPVKFHPAEAPFSS
jgi:hypothetical protein